MQKLGFAIRNDWRNNYGYDLELSHSTNPKPLRDFDAETAKVEKSLADLKRTYTLKLFTGGEEAKELFAALAKELAAIVTR